MGKFSSYYKIVKPQPELKSIQDSENISGGNLYASYSWYQRLVQGSSTRMTRYREYDTMDDSDVDVAIALDCISEEMTGNHVRTKIPFNLEIKDNTTQANDSLSVTLNTALSRWCEIHKWRSRMFPLARSMCKYGDIFFRRQRVDMKWSFLHPRHVIAAIVDKDDVTKIIGYQIRVDGKAAKGGQFAGSLQYGQDTMMEIVEAKDLIHFTTNDDMSDMAPFGESVLRPVYRAHKQKMLIEDAIIIYRVVRAPERRVFNIDVGNMPKHRVKQFLEQIKNDMKQKKVPSRAGDGNQVETVYNPHCIALDTRIPLLDGRTLPLSDIIELHNNGDELWAYSCNPETGEFAPGLISWAGVTRRNTETITVNLNNGKSFTCTPDHKIPTANRGFVEALDLTIGDNLFPFDTSEISDSSHISISGNQIVSILQSDHQDTGCITIDQDEIYHNYHTFAIESGIYIKNSMQEDFFFAKSADGRGSSIDTLPGGANLGELSDLEFFESKVARGLRIPLSYWGRKTSESQPIFNDGRVGNAYIEELRFSKYIQRLQVHIEEICDAEFKRFLRDLNINVDETSFEIRMQEPTNFAKYRQQELDSAQLNNMNNAKDIPMLSKRFVMGRYLGMTNDDILQNERMLSEELGIPTSDPDFIKKVYSTAGDDFSGSFGASTDSGLNMSSGGDDIGGSFEDDIGDDQTPDELGGEETEPMPTPDEGSIEQQTPNI